MAPNDRMFPNTARVSVSNGFLYAKKRMFGEFQSALKVIYLFRCLKGTLVASKVLGDFFVSSESC